MKIGLPEKEGNYLVYPNKYSHTACFQKYDSKRWKANEWTLDDENGYEYVVTVTHWQPLPEPPMKNSLQKELTEGGE